MSSYYNHLIGNESIKKYLNRMVEKKAVANSLLFAGPSGIGKSLFAKALATQLVGGDLTQASHPDIHHFFPEGKLGLHSIQSLRQFIDEVHLPPYEAPWKVFIIHEADRMLSYSANALLKTFEEPPPQTVIILISHAPSNLLNTIRSRCRTLHFQSIEEENIASFLEQKYTLPEERARHFAAHANGSLGRAINWVERGENPTRKLILDTLSRNSLGLYRNISNAVKEIADQMDSIKKEIEIKAKQMQEGMYNEYTSAVQQSAIEKELEGAISVTFMNESRSIFDDLLSWYRDLSLLQIDREGHFLVNIDYREALHKVLDSGKVISYEKAQKIVREAWVSLERSTPFHICLENLFLKFIDKNV